ncbi:MAG: transcriptional regulator, AraC family [Paenibacillaceae bacterium]|nr:transcriptional regulator, AraC family [Paenibacillaceae bacterium]
MTIRFSELMLKIELIYDKPPLPGWQDQRRSIHLHSLYWVHEGRGVFTLDGCQFPVGPGTLLYLCPGRELWMLSDTDNPLHMTMILFQAAAVTHTGGIWEVKQLTSLETAEVQTLRGTDQEDCESRIKALRKAWAPGDDGREAAACNLLLRLIRAVSGRRAARGGQERSAAGTDSASIGRSGLLSWEAAKRYLDTHYFADIRLTQVAEDCGISLRQLRRRFLEELGAGPKEYLDKVRYEHALRLLEHTDEPLKRIAAACGYYDEFHFSKCFKKAGGLSPSAYRSANPKREWKGEPREQRDE